MLATAIKLRQDSMFPIMNFLTKPGMDILRTHRIHHSEYQRSGMILIFMISKYGFGIFTEIHG